jgi:hypothetical protein
VEDKVEDVLRAAKVVSVKAIPIITELWQILNLDRGL